MEATVYTCFSTSAWANESWKCISDLQSDKPDTPGVWLYPSCVNSKWLLGVSFAITLSVENIKFLISLPAKPQSDFLSAAAVCKCITLHPALLPWEEWPGNSAAWSISMDPELKTDAANAFRRRSAIRNGAERTDAVLCLQDSAFPPRGPHIGALFLR